MLPLLVSAVLAAAEPSRPVISVLYFENDSKDAELDVLRKGLADMIVTDLVTWDGVTVVERDRLEAVLKELDLQATKRFDPTTAVKVGKLIGAQYTISGKMLLAGTKLRLDATLVNVQTSAAVGSASVTGDKDKVFDLEQELVLRITSAIDSKLKGDPSARKKSKVPDFEALVAYSKAIDLSDHGKLDEAQAAMQALVSKSPAFLMARERKQQLLEKLKEFEKRRKDMTTDSVLQLGRLADEGLKQEPKFDGLDEKAQRRFLSMRIIKGRFMLRAAKQFLSWRRENLRMPLKGKEAQALGVMRAWLDNQRHLIDEHGRYVKAHTTFSNGVPISPSTNNELEPELEKLLRDAKFGDVSISNNHVFPLLQFVLEGRAQDGEESYTIAPALGDLDPKEQKAAFDLIDQRLDSLLAAHAKAPVAQQSQYEYEAIQLLERKADALLRLDRDEDAIAALQKILDLFPAASAATQAERKIKQLLGAEHDHGREEQERWAKALTGCDDMDIRVGMGTLYRRELRMGLKGLDAQAGELEKACKLTAKTRSAFAYMYKDLALEAANHEDCDAFRAWFKKYVEADGSIGDMMGYQKNWTPWCELGDVTKSVLWFTAKLDQNWNLECNHNLVSILSNDKKVLSLDATDDNLHETLYFRLEPAGGAWKCVLATWQRQGERLETKECEVKLTKLAEDRGDFDEGTFGAMFHEKGGDFPRKLELSDGKFRLRRTN